MNKFIKLAIDYSKGLEEDQGICENLSNYCISTPSEEGIFFEIFFKPTLEEILEYQNSTLYWMEGHFTTDVEDRNTRITALLFAAELWEDKENHKYERK